MGTKDPRADAERYLEKHNVRGLFKHLSTKVRHSRGAAARNASWHRIAPRCARSCFFSRPFAHVSPRPAPRPQRPAGFVREARGPQSFPRPGTSPRLPAGPSCPSLRSFAARVTDAHLEPPAVFLAQTRSRFRSQRSGRCVFFFYSFYGKTSRYIILFIENQSLWFTTLGWIPNV